MAMASYLRPGFCASGSNEGIFRFCPSMGMGSSQQLTESKSTHLPSLKSDFKGRLAVVVSNGSGLGVKSPPNFSPRVRAETSICVNRALRWWDKTIIPNMIEINSAQKLVDTLFNAGDKLVIIDFYSPGCGGCRNLHPKICQLAESNPDAIFLKVNYEELKTMCHILNIRVLPFFRFYRGAEGRICSFSCTIATIKKLKNALAKHGTNRCSLGPAKGLDESELLNLASNGEIKIDIPSRGIGKEKMEDLVSSNNMNVTNSSTIAMDKIGEVNKEDAVLVA